MEVRKRRGAYVFHPRIPLVIDGKITMIFILISFSVSNPISIFNHGVSWWSGLFFFPDRIFKKSLVVLLMGPLAHEHRRRGKAVCLMWWGYLERISINCLTSTRNERSLFFLFRGFLITTCRVGNKEKGCNYLMN